MKLFLDLFAISAFNFPTAFVFVSKVSQFIFYLYFIYFLMTTITFINIFLLLYVLWRHHKISFLAPCFHILFKYFNFSYLIYSKRKTKSSFNAFKKYELKFFTSSYFIHKMNNFSSSHFLYISCFPSRAAHDWKRAFYLP